MDYLTKNTPGIIGLDTESTNSEENILNTFPQGASGTYAVVSYPFHLARFLWDFNSARINGKIPWNLKLKYAPTNMTIREIG